MIFGQVLSSQLESLVINPLQPLIDSGYFDNPDARRLIIIDGLDECVDRWQQKDILTTIFTSIQKFGTPILYLIASRPERDITFCFSSYTGTGLHREVVLDGDYLPHEDIRVFLTDKFLYIRHSHHQKDYLQHWPTEDVIEELVRKSSGQFIYASTVIKYVESLYHRPDHRLDILRNLRPRRSDSDMPFAELDTLYTHILSTFEEIGTILHYFGLHIYRGKMTDELVNTLILQMFDCDISALELLVGNLSALVKPNGLQVTFIHASMTDFLLDPTRSKTLHIEKAWATTKILGQCFEYLSRKPFQYSKCRLEFSANDILV